MTHIKRDKIASHNKDTRWDRIRKRHGGSGNSANLKTETVKRFIEIDYVGKHQQNILNGAAKAQTVLDPVLVMDLRHQMVSFTIVLHHKIERLLLWNVVDPN